MKSGYGAGFFLLIGTFDKGLFIIKNEIRRYDEIISDFRVKSDQFVLKREYWALFPPFQIWDI